MTVPVCYYCDINMVKGWFSGWKCPSCKKSVRKEPQKEYENTVVEDAGGVLEDDVLLTVGHSYSSSAYSQSELIKHSPAPPSTDYSYKPSSSYDYNSGSSYDSGSSSSSSGGDGGGDGGGGGD